MMMDRLTAIEMMKDIFTSSEAAEFLNISMQRLNQLVHEKRLAPIKSSKSVMLFLKSDLENRVISNVSNNQNINNLNSFNINIAYVRDAILYFTLQQFFNYNDKKTMKFLDDIVNFNHFDMRAGLKNNIPVLSNLLKTTEKEFYDTYVFVKDSFRSLTEDVVLIKRGDEIYPKLLANIVDAPLYLFLKGDIQLLNEKSVCVVGSRNASNDSMKKTKRIVQSLIKRNIVVNAGLAKGIDTATHIAALESGGKTIAVIGTPINQYYPKENKELQIKIEARGLVVSQFPPCNKVNRWNFPTRNATMSGLSLATIIMEAGETSGALKQADYALKQERKVLIPKSAIDNNAITWPKKYVTKGAKVFVTLKDVLTMLNKVDLLNDIFSSEDMEEITDVEMD
ncbi:MAG: DNA-protecting protein DprA [Bacilli bacterium]